jgi:protein-S-isoprenylcysteine O-methyltransferase Ste14
MGVNSSNTPWAVDLAVVAVAWIAFALVFLVRIRSLGSLLRSRARSRDRRALLGLVLQLVGYLIVRAGLRPGSASFLGLRSAGRVVVALLAGLLLASSVALAFAAARRLGKQWSLAARVAEGHELITTGAYRLVRHPIYTAMFGMLLGTALAVSTWWALLAGSAVFLAGTSIRIRVEERLLTAEFGDAYRNYAATVPALIPRWRRA